MVFQKRSDYGFNGCWAPTMPRVPRSAKGKRSARRKVEDKQMYAFDLLVAVAGKLLLERECSMKPSDVNGLLSPTAKGSVIKQEQLEEKKLIKDEAFDQGSCSESTLDSKFSSQKQGNCVRKERPYTAIPDPIVVEPDVSIEDVKPGGLHINGTVGGFMHNLGTSPEKFGNRTSSFGYAESCEGRVGTAVKTLHQAEWQINGHLIDEDAINIRSEDPMDLDRKHTVSRSSHSSVGVPPCGDHNRSNTFLTKSRKHVELAIDRDDDENSSACTHTNSMTPRAVRLHRVGDRRIRKLLACKHWKTAPIISRNGELSNTNVEMKPVFRGRKLCCTRQRTQSSFKRRKVHERSAISACENSFSFKSIGNLSEKDLKVETSNACAALCGVNGANSSMTGQRPSYESDDFHVKLNIKSFKVPELFIEIPETATVASLKRTVMETVTAVLGGGMRVGVLFQGRKVRDDNKTLSQVGISHGDKLDNLGFTLEPNSKPAPPPIGSPEVLHPLPCFAAEPLTRLPSVAPTTDPGTSGAIPEAPLNPVVNILESDHDSVQSPVEANSRALVPVPPMTVEALSVVPFRKSKHPELVQRRIRRPFSVAEVEALVQAVEKLGTGRWRDVKIRSFDNAKHRTYVDLKDKWKTLVHTARISPQQRRGEPVPQELLDRVLVAHAYWSQQQAKLQAKPPKAAACLPAPLI